MSEYLTDAEQKEVERRERQELIHALRNFGEHFGAATVYREAMALYRETPEGRAETEAEATASFESALRDANRPITERQKRPAANKRPNGGSPAAEAARKLLGG